MAPDVSRNVCPSILAVLGCIHIVCNKIASVKTGAHDYCSAAQAATHLRHQTCLLLVESWLNYSFHARNVARIFLGGRHQSLTFLSVDFPAELV